MDKNQEFNVNKIIIKGEMNDNYLNNDNNQQFQKIKNLVIVSDDSSDINTVYENVEYLEVSDNDKSDIWSEKKQLISVTDKKKRRTFLKGNQRKHICTICKKVFLDRQTLQEHSVTHQAKKPYECHICHKRVSRMSRLRKHLISHEKPEFRYVPLCLMCGEVFADEKLVKTHLSRDCKALEDVDDCEDCDDSRCIGTIYIDRVLTCEFCEKAFEKNEHLLDHKIEHENDPYPFKCEFCSETFNAFSKLKSHKLAHGSTDMLRQRFPVQKHYSCDIGDCEKTYIHWPDLNSHKKTVHLINSPLYGCRKCGQKFTKSWNLAYHKKTMHESDIIKCDSCPKTFLLESHFAKHKVNCVHSKNTLEVKCLECNKIFKTNSILQTHIKNVHLKIINYKCTYCAKGFFSINDKVNHERMHTKVKPFTCEYCNYQCRTKSMLTQHKGTHTEYKPFQCQICHMSFRRAYALKIHFKIHTEKRKYRCTAGECIKVYRSQSGLNAHLQKCHDEKKKVPLNQTTCVIMSIDEDNSKSDEFPNSNLITYKSKNKEIYETIIGDSNDQNYEPTEWYDKQLADNCHIDDDNNSNDSSDYYEVVIPSNNLVEVGEIQSISEGHSLDMLDDKNTQNENVALINMDDDQLKSSRLVIHFENNKEEILYKSKNIIAMPI